MRLTDERLFSMYSIMWLQWLHFFISKYLPGIWCNPLWVTFGLLGYRIKPLFRKLKNKLKVAGTLICKCLPAVRPQVR